MIRLDDRLLNSDAILAQLEETRRRFKDDEHQLFLEVLPYLQYNVPYGELEKLFSEPLYPRAYQEIDPVSQEILNRGKDLDEFKQYAEDRNGNVKKEGYSYLFLGGNGSGKTMLALYILCRFIERGNSGFYTFWSNYMHQCNESRFSREDRTVVNHCYNCDLLVLDELGKESKASPNVLSELESLLKHRSASNLPTIVITNLSFLKEDEEKDIPSIHKRYGNSIRNLWMDKYRVFQFSARTEFRAKMRKKWQI